MMATSPKASAQVTDVLNSLLEAEQNSVFRFMDEGSPYLGRATAEVRKPLREVIEAAETFETGKIRKDALAAVEELKTKGSLSSRNSVFTNPPPSAVTIDESCALIVCAMRNAA